MVASCPSRMHNRTENKTKRSWFFLEERTRTSNLETVAEATAYPVWKVFHAVRFAVKVHTAKGLWIPAYKREFKKPFQQLQFRAALLCWHIRLWNGFCMMIQEVAKDKMQIIKAWQMTQNHQLETQCLYQSYFM